MLTKAFFLLCLAIGSVGCAALNRPSCRLQGGQPLPPAHKKPYQPAPWGSGDQAFPYSVWTPKSGRPAKAVVILVPGWDGAVTDYKALAEHLAAQGYAVYGSEQATGVYDPIKRRQGDPHDWHPWVDDLEAFTTFVRSKHPKLPWFYHAHSFGTLVATEVAGTAPVAARPSGLIIQSMAMPLLIDKESAAKGAILDLFAWVRVPHLRLAGELAKPTGDETQNCQWLNSPDRLAQGYKVRYFHEAAKLGHQARIASRTLQIPVLALEGEKDGVVAPKPKDKQAYDRFLRHELSGGNARVISYRNGFHTMTIPPTGNPALDQTSRQAQGDITKWLDRRVRMRGHEATEESRL